MKKILKKPLLAKIGKIMAIFILVIILSGASIKMKAKENKTNSEVKYVAPDYTRLIASVEEKTNNLEDFLVTNEEQLRFFAYMFDMNYDGVIAKIREVNVDTNNINNENIGLLKDANGNIINYSTIDRGILEYFIYLEQNNPELISAQNRPCTETREYIEGLVEYFSFLYGNVDHKLMLSIGAAESGYYTASTMLYKNNIYGGMGGNGLIPYKNIEYGVWQYIKRMSEQYYDKGLNTIESIGYVFCPRTENGVKTVSSHWVSLVNKALATYNHDIRYVTVAQLNDLKNNEI